MNDNPFFKPTPLYKEFMILDLIEKNPSLTQREIGDAIGVAVSMVNAYLDEYEEKGFIIRKKYSTKTVEYYVTKDGVERRKLLNIWYLKSSQEVYSSAINNIKIFLNQIVEKGFRKILLYGAGEVAEILLQAINSDTTIPIDVLGVIDDDKTKHGQHVLNTAIVPFTELDRLEHDGILVSSYAHHDMIKNRLLQSDYDSTKIIEFFE
jgi:DNA-binding MarR family transcriptional regulator